MKAPIAPDDRRRSERPKQTRNLGLNSSPISFLLMRWTAAAATAAVLTTSASAAEVAAATASYAPITSGQTKSMTGAETIPPRATRTPRSTAFAPSAPSSGENRLRRPTRDGRQRHQRQRSSAFTTRLATPTPLQKGERAGRGGTAVAPPLRIAAAARPCSPSTLSAAVAPGRPKAVMMISPSASPGAAAGFGVGVGGTRRRTFGGRGAARCAVVENQSSGPQGGPADSVVVDPQQQRGKGGDHITNLTTGSARVARDDGKGNSRDLGVVDANDTLTDGGASFWEGLGSWEGLGEGLSGAFLFAQQGLEGLHIMGVGDTFWVNFTQMDVPELPVLPELHIFGLKWPPPQPPPPPLRAADAAGEEKKGHQPSPAIAGPALATKGAAERTATTALAAAASAGEAAQADGGSSGAGSVPDGDGDRGAPANRQRWRLPGRLSAWRRERPAAAAAAAINGGDKKISINTSPVPKGGGRTTAAAAAEAAPAAGGNVNMRWQKDDQREPRGVVADNQEAAAGWRWGKLFGGEPGSTGGSSGRSTGTNATGGESSSDGSAAVERIRGAGVVQKGGKISLSVLEPATESGQALPATPLQSVQRQQQQEKKERNDAATPGLSGRSGRGNNVDGSGSSSHTVSLTSSRSTGDAKGAEKGAPKRTEGRHSKPQQEAGAKSTKASSPPPPLAPPPPSDGPSLSLATASPTGASEKAKGNVQTRGSKNPDDDSGAGERGTAGGVPDSGSSNISGEGGPTIGGAGGAGAAPSAPTKFIPKFAPPPNAWKIISSKFPVDEQKQQTSSQNTAVRSSDDGSSTPGWQGSASEGGDAEGDDLHEDDDNFHDFGDVSLSVRKIPEPPNMEITINRSSGTPANAETRPVAAAAAKAAADSDNVLEEWVDGEPVQVHHGRTASRRQPNRPADLTATSGEMKLVEMACLTGLSCRAGKSAGRVMGEEVGFGHLLRGLREDVRPSLRRRVLQAISTVVDSDPALAPRLLGLVGDDDAGAAEQRGEGPKNKKSTQKKRANGSGASAASTSGVKKTQAGARAVAGRRPARTRRRTSGTGTGSTPTPATTATSISGAAGVGATATAGGSSGGAWVRFLQGLAERRRRRRVRLRRVAVGSSGPATFPGEEGVSSAAFPDGDAVLFGEDDLLERITTILGYHGSGTGFGAGVGPADGGRTEGKTGGGVGALGRAFRAVFELLRAPRLRPFFVAARDSGAAGSRKRQEQVSSGGLAAGARSAATAEAPKGAGGGVPNEEAETMGEGEGAREGRDWWKDEVALEEEGLEQKAAASAGVGQGKEGGSGWVWWWGRGRRVSRERLVEEALELTFRLVMSGDVALEALKVDKKLVAALKKVAEGGGQRLQYDSKGVLRRFGPRLTSSQLLANKCLASLGAHEWRPKMRGQKGVRILCFDGGGTRGVLTVALLKHVEKALGGRQPHEVFDMIVGTSTGGIIAGLAGVKGFPVAECERMYDSLINKIFIKHPGGGVKLALKQAFYDEVGWMKILSSILADQLMVDSAQDPLRPLIVCPSTIISSNPARVMLWRNYNYPPGHQSRYYGSFRYKVREAIRATTAAPTFFPPLMINGALYSDGALLCNNPSAVAFHEAKHVFPGVPIEMIVSIGTGCFFEEKKEFDEPALGWDGIINQVIASATETEITTDIVSDLLPKEQYFRFNPRMEDMPIDEVRKERLDWLKTLADEYFEMPENQARLQEMAERMLPDSL